MGIDAILQGDDGGVLADHGLDLLAGALDVPQLYAEQHDVDGADRARVVGGLYRHDMHRATTAFDPESFGLHGGEMCAARDEGDILARLGKCCAIAASDAARTDDRNPHEVLS